MTHTDAPAGSYGDLLTAARGWLGALLDTAALPDLVVLDVCDALNELDPPDRLPTYPARVPAVRDAVGAPHAARACLRAAIPTLPDAATCAKVTHAIGHVDAALTHQATP